MLKNKKLMMALSFTLGITLLVSSAFADITSASGYEQLKQAMKYTSKTCAKNLKSYTNQLSVTIKDNETVLYNSTKTNKFDNILCSSSNKCIKDYNNGTTEIGESYHFKKSDIWYNSWNDTYQIYEYAEKVEHNKNTDIFEEDEMKDVERIIDAGVGNLEDYVIVSEKTDGSKEFSGSLGNAQIPALVNAISSFAFKRVIPDISSEIGDSFPKIKNDVFIKKVSGKATVNKDGLLERIYGSGIISGKDDDGISHDLTVEILLRIYDINSTVVTKPDLTGKKVEKQYENNSLDMNISKKYIGKYKQDIVIDKNNSFVKIGERIVVIDHIDSNHILGKYFETYKSKYEEYSADKREFDFDAEIDGYNNAKFELSSDQNNKEIVNIYLNEYNGKIYFSIDFESKNVLKPLYKDATFIRVFED